MPPLARFGSSTESNPNHLLVICDNHKSSKIGALCLLYKEVQSGLRGGIVRGCVHANRWCEPVGTRFKRLKRRAATLRLVQGWPSVGSQREQVMGFWLMCEKTHTATNLGAPGH